MAALSRFVSNVRVHILGCFFVAHFVMQIASQFLTQWRVVKGVLQVRQIQKQPRHGM